MNVPDELNGWDQIIADAESGVTTREKVAEVRAVKKQVLAIANLGQTIFSIQKVFGSRLDNLKESIDKFNSESSKLYKINIILTIVIALATVANVLIVMFRK